MFTIQLTKGQATTVDDVDAELNELKWAFTPARSRSGYAYHSDFKNGKKTTVYLHRLIMERVIGRKLETHEQVDHKDGNSLNNLRSNLRIATASQNQANSRIRSDNTSGYKGVFWDKKRQYWYALIWVNGKSKRVGRSDTAQGAYEQRLKVLAQFHGEFARGE